MKSLLVFASFVLASMPSAVLANGIQTATVQARATHRSYVFYARVESTQPLVLRAGATGTLAHFTVKPGNRVRRGEPLARLAGPTYDAALASAEAALTVATKSDALAYDNLRATQARYPLLSDRAALDRAKMGVFDAQANLVQTRAKLKALTSHGRITAPVAGTVSAVLRGNGERVAPGDAILRIQPHDSLWLRGTVYGTTIKALQVGLHGVFRPAGGGGPIPVRMASLIPGTTSDGMGIGMVPIQPHPHWFSGESGLVTLEGPAVHEPAVPSSALVLAHGHWWVVKKVKGGFKPVRVKRDFSRGGWTWIGSGLKSGAKVVVTNAYLIFHRTFAEQYSGD